LALTGVQFQQTALNRRSRFMSCYRKLWPNTALEPTADPRFGLPGSVGFATRQFGGGSAFVR
jgi:hypothetical protein